MEKQGGREGLTLRAPPTARALELRAFATPPYVEILPAGIPLGLIESSSTREGVSVEGSSAVNTPYPEDNSSFLQTRHYVDGSTGLLPSFCGIRTVYTQRSTAVVPHGGRAESLTCARRHYTIRRALLHLKHAGALWLAQVLK